MECRMKNLICPSLDEVFSSAKEYPRVQERIEDFLLSEGETITREKAEEMAKDSFYNEYIDIKEMIEYLFKEEEPKLYHAMGIVDFDDFIGDMKKYGKSYDRKELKGLGTSWTFSIEKAIAYYCRYGDIYLIGALVNPLDIDIEKTFMRGFVFDFKKEKEITIKENSRITITVICKEDKENEDWMECTDYDLTAYT